MALNQEKYVSSWPLGDEEMAEFRRRLNEVAPFELGGQYTYRLYPDEKTEQQAYAALAFVWREVEKMMAAAQSELDR